MLKPKSSYYRAALSIASLLFLGFFIWIFSTSSTFKHCSANQEKAETYAAQNQSPPSSFAAVAINTRCVGHAIYEYRDAAIAIATVFIALFTATLWYSTRNLWIAGEKQFSALNRPHIIVHAIEFKRFPGVDQYDLAGASLLCFNKGSTSAVNVEARGDILISHDPPAVDVQRKLVQSTPELVSGQKLRIELNSGRPARELTAFLTDRPGMRATNPTMYCVGTISYRDQNGMRRETGYCFMIDPDRLRWLSAQSPEHEYSY